MISELLRQIQPYVQTITPKEEEYDPCTNWSILDHSEQKMLTQLVRRQNELDLSIRSILQRSRLSARPSRVAYIKFLIVNRFTGREHL